jgi:hypothetical protein
LPRPPASRWLAAPGSTSLAARTASSRRTAGLVGDGVRGLAAGMPEVPQPARPQRTRRRRLPRPPVRYAMVAVGSAAAALVLLLAIGSAAGVVQLHLSGGGTTTLTAVTGCAGLSRPTGRSTR